MQKGQTQGTDTARCSSVGASRNNMFQRWGGRYNFIVPSQDLGLPGGIETACSQSKEKLHQKLTCNYTCSANSILRNKRQDTNYHLPDPPQSDSKQTNQHVNNYSRRGQHLWKKVTSWKPPVAPSTVRQASPSQQTHWSDTSHSESATKLVSTQVLAPRAGL